MACTMCASPDRQLGLSILPRRSPCTFTTRAWPAGRPSSYHAELGFPSVFGVFLWRVPGRSRATDERRLLRVDARRPVAHIERASRCWGRWALLGLIGRFGEWEPASALLGVCAARPRRCVLADVGSPAPTVAMPPSATSCPGLSSNLHGLVCAASCRLGQPRANLGQARATSGKQMYTRHQLHPTGELGRGCTTVALAKTRAMRPLPAPRVGVGPARGDHGETRQGSPGQPLARARGHQAHGRVTPFGEDRGALVYWVSLDGEPGGASATGREGSLPVGPRRPAKRPSRAPKGPMRLCSA